MKKIELDTIFEDELGVNRGLPIMGEDGQAITLRKVLITHCGLYQPQTGDEAIQAMDIGIKIKNANETIDLEDADFKFLKEKLLSQSKFIAMIMAKVFQVLNDTEKGFPISKDAEKVEG